MAQRDGSTAWHMAQRDGSTVQLYAVYTLAFYLMDINSIQERILSTFCTGVLIILRMSPTHKNRPFVLEAHTNCRAVPGKIALHLMNSLYPANSRAPPVDFLWFTSPQNKVKQFPG